MQIQTVFKAGNSNVVAIPSEFVNNYGYETGLQVMLNTYDQGETLMIKKVNTSKTNKKQSKSSQEFEKWLKNTLVEDAEILDGLA
ncbi:MAG: hypothetical protein Q8Q30_00545 [Candidatus Woesebacteria bacterium]|nr:hypothetical protein [Candidatus Woesebacteria bacterium]